MCALRRRNTMPASTSSGPKAKSVTQAKLEELKLRHPAVGCAYRLGMYFDTISSLPRGFDTLPECDGYSSYFEETDLEDDGLSDLMFAKIPGDSASVVDMQVAEQVLLTREKKTHRTCHTAYRPSSFIKYQHSNLETRMSTTYVKNNGVYTAASSGYGTALLSPQSSSQPEYGTWGGKDEYFNSQNSQNSSDRSVKNSVINKQHTSDSSTVKSPSKTLYRTKPLPPTPIELSQSPTRTIVEERPPFSSQKLFDIRRMKPVNIDAVRIHQISGSVQTLGSQASVISGDYSRPWDLKKSNIKYSSGRKSSVKYDSKGHSRSSQKPQMSRSSSNGTPSHLTRPAAKKKDRKEFGKHLECEPEHIYESITDMDNDYDEIPEAEILPNPSVRGLNQKIHNLSIEHSVSSAAVSRSMSAAPLTAVSSAGRIGKRQQQLQQQKSLKKSPKSAATVTPATITLLNNNLSDPFGSLHKRKGQGKRRATIPEGTFVKCSDKPRSGSQPVINYGIV